MEQTDFIVTPAKTGESCPCCGQPIKTRDPALLWLLGWIRQTQRLPADRDDIYAAFCKAVGCGEEPPEDD